MSHFRFKLLVSENANSRRLRQNLDYDRNFNLMHTFELNTFTGIMQNDLLKCKKQNNDSLFQKTKKSSLLNVKSFCFYFACKTIDCLGFITNYMLL